MSSPLATLRWLGSALTQPQPAELAALPQPEARADRAALLSLAAINLIVLMLALALARPQAPRQPTPPAVPTARSSAEAA